MHFAYCNTSYVLLALLIEKITKTSYPSFIRKTIFEPSGMKNTFVYTDADSAKTNPSYDWKNQEQAFINLDKVYGDKNIFSTPRDLLIWDRLLISNQFLKASTLAEAYRPYSNEKNGIKGRMEAMKGVPWEPVPGREGIEIHSRVTMPEVPKEVP